MAFNNVKLFRLLTGEDILAEEVDNDDITRDKIRLKNPIKIVVIPDRANPRNPPQIAFAPWLTFTDETEFDIYRAAMITSYVPMAQMLDQYKQTFSKIALPNQGLILPTSR